MSRVGSIALNEFLNKVDLLSKAFKHRNNDTLRLLKQELAHLKSKFKLGQELKLDWTPNSRSKSGEVQGTAMRIYEADQAKALETLRHEFIEYLLTQDLVAPYKRLINKLISLFDEEMYDRTDLGKRFLRAFSKEEAVQSP